MCYSFMRVICVLYLRLGKHIYSNNSGCEWTVNSHELEIEM